MCGIASGSGARAAMVPCSHRRLRHRRMGRADVRALLFRVISSALHRSCLRASDGSQSARDHRPRRGSGGEAWGRPRGIEASHAGGWSTRLFRALPPDTRR